MFALFIIVKARKVKAKRPAGSGLLGIARDTGIALLAVALIMGALYGYTGIWPPMVVVESESMMHGDDSEVGVIDTGDLTLVKMVEKRSDIVTYLEGRKTGYKTYGNYGDVIIYRKNGRSDVPVIHRAVLWAVYNESARGYDIPEAGAYGVQTTFVIQNYTFYSPVKRVGPLEIDFHRILVTMQAEGSFPHSGFITKGDHNQIIDQAYLNDSAGRKVEPVMVEWVVGRAVGELPWFGLIKLWASKSLKSEAPPSSVRYLIVTIVLLIIIPFVLDMAASALSKRRKRRATRRQRGEDE